MAYTIFTVQDGVATLTFNRPEKYNSIHREMALQIQAHLDTAQEEDSIRALVITGEGKAFCAGQDLAEVVEPDGPPLKDIVTKHYNPIIRKITSLKKPVIAAVNGVAAGAGANIALNCDIVVAKKSATFIQAFSKIGLIPDSGGTYILPRLVGYQKALAITMLGDKISAVEAERMGMIYQFFEEESFEEGVQALAQKLAQMPTYGLALTKQAYQLGAQNTLEQQLLVEGHLQTLAGQSYDYNEGVQAFLEKRKPSFKGK